jgi:hypothetical protein
LVAIYSAGVEFLGNIKGRVGSTVELQYNNQHAEIFALKGYWYPLFSYTVFDSI